MQSAEMSALDLLLSKTAKEKIEYESLRFLILIFSNRA